jgi:hypothetical protein
MNTPTIPQTNPTRIIQQTIDTLHQQSAQQEYVVKFRLLGKLNQLFGSMFISKDPLIIQQEMRDERN